MGVVKSKKKTNFVSKSLLSLKKHVLKSFEKNIEIGKKNLIFYLMKVVFPGHF